MTQYERMQKGLIHDTCDEEIQKKTHFPEYLQQQIDLISSANNEKTFFIENRRIHEKFID